MDPHGSPPSVPESLSPSWDSASLKTQQTDLPYLQDLVLGAEGPISVHGVLLGRKRSNSAVRVQKNPRQGEKPPRTCPNPCCPFTPTGRAWDKPTMGTSRACKAGKEPLQRTFSKNLFKEPLQRTFAKNIFEEPFQRTFSMNLFEKPFQRTFSKQAIQQLINCMLN